MSLLLPLGLLGLIGIIVLIIIYLIKPNYQNKFISSTFVWKLSLKYRKKKLPTSKLKNILLIICQILILTLLAFILAKPVHMYLTSENPEEVVLIIDSSASMRAIDDADGETRYEKVVSRAKSQAAETFSHNGVVSVIVADRKAEFLVSRVDSTKSTEVNSALDELVSGVDLACSYGTSDVTGAIELCDDVIADNADAQIYLYTDTSYNYVPKGITVVKPYNSQPNSFNAAILNAYTEFNNNYYDIVVEMATYGQDAMVSLEVVVDGANKQNENDQGITIKYSGPDYQVDCSGDQTMKVTFKASQFNDAVQNETSRTFDISEDRFYSFKTIHIKIDEQDAFVFDDNFYIYGGDKELIKVQYASRLYNSEKGSYEGSTNPFVNGILSTIASSYSDKYEFEITEQSKGEFVTEGFDIYIFEHEMPEKLPTDGIVFIIDPQSTISNSGFTPTANIDFNAVSQPLTVEDETHPLMKNIAGDEITVSRYVKLSNYDASYQILATIDSDPALMVRNEGNSKIVILNFSLHYSNLALTADWVYLFINFMNYFYPSTLNTNVMEVYNAVTVNARGEKIGITYSVEDDVIYDELTEFPCTYTASTPGTYAFSQTTYYNDDLLEYVYVKVPAYESNIFPVEDLLEEPYRASSQIDTYDDLLFWFALSLSALILIEWWLKSRENA